jgi:hypothetical protein
MSPREYFEDYFTNINEIFLTHGIEDLVMWTNILPRVHGQIIFMDDK